MKCIVAKITFLFALIVMQSCIKEDNPDCKQSALRLRFRYTLNNQYSDLFGTQVQRVTVYVFDAKDKYVGRYSESGDKLASNYTMTIPLPKGCYWAVAFCDNLNTFSSGWVDHQTNSFNNTLRPGITTVSDFRIMLNNKQGTDGYLVPGAIPGDLYAGYEGEALSTDDVSYITDVDLMKNTKNIVVKISGLESLTPAGIVPDVYITSVNGRYKYDNSIDTSHEMFKYSPHHTSVTENILNSYLKTMRLIQGHAPMLVIKLPSTAKEIFGRDITELILSAPKYKSQQDIDREDTFVFEVNFKQTDNDIVISISINGWTINTVTPAND